MAKSVNGVHVRKFDLTKNCSNCPSNTLVLIDVSTVYAPTGNATIFRRSTTHTYRCAMCNNRQWAVVYSELVVKHVAR